MSTFRRAVMRPSLGLVAAVYGAAAATCAAMSTSGGPQLVGAVAAGVLSFSFVEYAVHRWLLHGVARGLGPEAYDRAHGGHHRKPSDASRRAVPLPYSAAIALPLVAGARALGGPGAGLAFAAGLLGGYVLFEAAHAALHVPRWSARLPWLRKHHARHHHVDDGAAFGVTTPLWDAILGTMPARPHPFAVCPSPGDDADHSDAI